MELLITEKKIASLQVSRAEGSWKICALTFQLELVRQLPVADRQIVDVAFSRMKRQSKLRSSEQERQHARKECLCSFFGGAFAALFNEKSYRSCKFLFHWLWSIDTVQIRDESCRIEKLGSRVPHRRHDIIDHLERNLVEVLLEHSLLGSAECLLDSLLKKHLLDALIRHQCNVGKDELAPSLLC